MTTAKERLIYARQKLSECLQRSPQDEHEIAILRDLIEDYAFADAVPKFTKSYRLLKGHQLVGWVRRFDGNPTKFQVILPSGKLSEALKLREAKKMAERLAHIEWKKSDRSRLSWHY